MSLSAMFNYIIAVNSFYLIFVLIPKMHIISVFLFSLVFINLQAVELCSFLWNFTYMYMLCLPNSPYSFQPRRSLFYGIFVIIPKICCHIIRIFHYCFQFFIGHHVCLSDTANVRPKEFHFKMIKQFDVIWHIFKLINPYPF